MEPGSGSVDEVSSAHVVSKGTDSACAAPALSSSQDFSSPASSALDEVSGAVAPSTAHGMSSVSSASSCTVESDPASVSRASKRAGDASIQLPPRKHVVVSVPSAQSSASQLSAPCASRATGKPLRYRQLNMCYSTLTAKLIPGEVRAVSSESCDQGVDLSALLYDCPADEVRQCAASFEDKPGAGLKNLGSTCFVSAVIQCLVNVKAYSTLMLGHARMCGSGPDDCVLCALAQSYEAIRRGGEALLPSLSQLARREELGNDYALPLNKGETNGQADAALFLQAVFSHIREKEIDQASALQLELRPGAPYVLREYVHGYVCRERLACSMCNVARDSLEWHDIIQLHIGSRREEGPVELESLWQKHWSEHKLQTDSSTALCPGSPGRCRQPARRQLFLEIEPNVLIIHLLRGRQEERYEYVRGRREKVVYNRYKMTRRVLFPEWLDFCRTGPYRFLSVVRHIGETADTGHYVTTCRHGEDSYFEYDDEKVTLKTWKNHLATSQVQRQAVVLMYVRTDFWNDKMRTGAEDTPYVRAVRSSCTRSTDAAIVGDKEPKGDVRRETASGVSTALSSNIASSSSRSKQGTRSVSCPLCHKLLRYRQRPRALCCWKTPLCHADVEL